MDAGNVVSIFDKMVNSEGEVYFTKDDVIFMVVAAFFIGMIFDALIAEVMGSGFSRVLAFVRGVVARMRGVLMFPPKCSSGPQPRRNPSSTCTDSSRDTSGASSGLSRCWRSWFVSAVCGGWDECANLVSGV